MIAVLKTMERRAVAEALEANAVECVKSWCAWPELTYHEERDMGWTMSPVPFAFFNNVLWARLSEATVDAGIDRAVTRAVDRGVPMAWWIGPGSRPRTLADRLEAWGFEHGDDTTGMAVPLGGIEERVAPGAIVEVEDTAGLESWVGVMARVFSFPDFAVAPLFRVYAACGFGPDRPWRHYLATLDGDVVGTSSLFLGAGVAGICNVGTLYAARRRGIGTALAVRPLLDARRAGYRVGVLWSSAAGLSLYRRLGFEVYGNGCFYFWSAEA